MNVEEPQSRVTTLEKNLKVVADFDPAGINPQRLMN